MVSFGGGRLCNLKPFNRKISPVDLVIEKGSLDLLRFVVEKVKNKNPADDRGWTPLHSAAYFGNSEKYRLIMQKVHDKNPVDHNGMTPLHIASQLGHLDVCKLIVQNIKDIRGINPENRFGFTPLNFAQEEKKWKIVAFLGSRFV